LPLSRVTRKETTCRQIRCAAWKIYFFLTGQAFVPFDCAFLGFTAAWKSSFVFLFPHATPESFASPGTFGAHSSGLQLWVFFLFWACHFHRQTIHTVRTFFLLIWCIPFRFLNSSVNNLPKHQPTPYANNDQPVPLRVLRTRQANLRPSVAPNILSLDPNSASD